MDFRTRLSRLSSEQEETTDIRSEVGAHSNVEEPTEVYLSLFHQAGYLGAAFYNVAEGVIYIMNDIADPAPQHRLVFSLLTQIDPKYLLVSSRHSDTIGEQVKTVEEDDENSRSQTANSQSRSRNDQRFSRSTSLETSAFAGLERNGENKLSESFQNVNVIVLPTKSFNLESAKRRIFSIKLPGEGEYTSAGDHFLTVQSFVNLKCEQMIRACGALLKVFC